MHPVPMPSRVLAISALIASLSSAADLPKAAALLEQHCLKCHNASVKMSGLSLVGLADATKGGLHGPAIIPGKPDDSNLIRMISGDKPKMPMQAAPLSAADVAEIRNWIAAGAPWPEALQPGRTQDTLWSLQPLTKPAVPRMESQWPRTPIDAFVLAKLN